MLAVTFASSLTSFSQLHYQPQGKSAVCINGTTKFNRALYGAHSGFRVDCCDFPEFGIYLPTMGGNLTFILPDGTCTATYTPGCMEYLQGGVALETQVGRTDDMALWKLTNVSNVPKTVSFRYGGATGKRFSREGDLGVDKPDCFDFKEENCNGNIISYECDNNAIVEFGTKERKYITIYPFDFDTTITELPSIEGTRTLKPNESAYFALVPGKSDIDHASLPSLMEKAEAERNALISTIRIDTPDPWLNPVDGALAIAADAIWSGEAWLHGSIGWRTPHLGWRGAYAGDAVGRHDRALTHFLTYADNQIDTIPQILNHPQQDTALNLARARKAWGTPMYSDGYICRRPGHKNEMSHYDMNLVYVDAMLRHFRHTGDTTAMRQLFPVLKRHFDWEKRNFDPDGDGLYDAYCCIWASDALYYNGGKVTHSSAYNGFANRLAAQVARKIGEDPTPYEIEADKITRAIDSALWMKHTGRWAEFQDVMGYKRHHENPGLWTIYHAIDSEIADMPKNWAATTYIDSEIPHIPVINLDGDTLYTISTTNWKPYSWSINNVAIAEVMHTALAYWQAGRPEEAYALLKANMLDNMYMGASPLNFGQISQFDAARGECYRDFADPIGVWSRALTEGLFGIRPNMIADIPVIELIPGFPNNWDHASIQLPDISYSYERDSTTYSYRIENRYPGTPTVRMTLPGRGIKEVLVNGRKTIYEPLINSVGYPRICFDVNFDADLIVPVSEVKVVYDDAHKANDGSISATASITGKTIKEGSVTFTEYSENNTKWLDPKIDKKSPMEYTFGDFSEVSNSQCHPIDISAYYNASVSDLFRNEYLSPRPTTTTLQIPKQGIGEWCHPELTADINDNGIRAIVKANHGIFTTDSGVPFRMESEGNNIIYTSLWDNYPDSVTIPLSGNASHIYLAMAGSTNHMQWGLPNALIIVAYADGTKEEFPLTNPVSWAPIEQDFYTDSYAFSQPDKLPLPVRFCMEDGTQGRRIGDLKGIKGVEPRRIQSGAGVLLDLPIQTGRYLESITLTTVANDVVAGLMSITIQ